jgi:multidrug efflux pump subunit AcrA (membrane-fusion protein)
MNNAPAPRRLRLIAALLILPAPFSATTSRGGEEVVVPPGANLLKHCLVTAIDDVQVPALRPGQLTAIHAREGARVEPESVVAQLNDAETKIQLRAANAERDVAAARAKSDIEVRYAQATHAVAVAEHRMSEEANKDVKAVSTVELERLKLSAEQAALKIEVGKFEREVRMTESGTTQAKAELAEHEVLQRQIRAPIGGEIAEYYVRIGEWVEVGRPVLRIVRLDRLRVEGFVHVRDSFPGEVLGRSVKVRLELARGEQREFSGRVTFVSPLVQAGGDYRIWAEIDNRREQDQWLLRPGLQAEMLLEPR